MTKDVLPVPKSIITVIAVITAIVIGYNIEILVPNFPPDQNDDRPGLDCAELYPDRKSDNGEITEIGIDEDIEKARDKARAMALISLEKNLASNDCPEECPNAEDEIPIFNAPKIISENRNEDGLYEVKVGINYTKSYLCRE